jgi:hypothetical protein
MKFILAALFAVASFSAQADRYFIDNNAQNTNKFWLYTETIIVGSDGVSFLIGSETLKTRREDRTRYGVTFADCNAGFGSYNIYLNNQWQQAGQWSKSGRTIGDEIAAFVCMTYWVKVAKSVKATHLL